MLLFIFIKHEIVLTIFRVIAPSTLAPYAESKFDDLRSKKAVSFLPLKRDFKKHHI